MEDDEIIVRYPYRIRRFKTGMHVLFFLLCSLLAGYGAIRDGDFLLWVATVLCAGFVVAGIVVTLLNIRYQSHITLTQSGIWVPKHRWTSQEEFIEKSDMYHLEYQVHAGQEMLVIDHEAGRHTLLGSMLPSRESFEEILSSLSNSTIHAVQHAKRVRSHKSGHSFRFLVLKLAALFSFCGGPLYWMELFEKSGVVFAIGFAPIALMILGILSLVEDSPSPLRTRIVFLGLLGAITLFLESVLALSMLAVNLQGEDVSLTVIGCCTGIAASVFYAYRTYQESFHNAKDTLSLSIPVD
ncbi:MAG: hypothetical protein VX278_13270 [Myxococcota bacterium]|nr:hypothetical protein [Myxococcota bacterium]